MAERTPNPCCEANVPRLSLTRPDGEEWTCHLCGDRWVYVIEESEGSMWVRAIDTEVDGG